MSSFKFRVMLGVGLLAVGGGIGFGAYRMTAIAKETAKTPTKTAADAAKPPLWGKTCDSAADGKQTCVVVQNVIITDKASNKSLRALVVAMGYVPGDDKLRMALTVPLGISLPTGVSFQIDEGQATTLPIETCLADGCRIVMMIDAGGRDNLVKSKQIKVVYQLVNGQKLALPVELAGLGDALAQLKPAL